MSYVGIMLAAKIPMAIESVRMSDILRSWLTLNAMTMRMFCEKN